jgi:hypothetical protein
VSEAADQYLGIAEIYDAWCLEVQEDIGFYVGMALGTETPVVELAAPAASRSRWRCPATT